MSLCANALAVRLRPVGALAIGDVGLNGDQSRSKGMADDCLYAEEKLRRLEYSIPFFGMISSCAEWGYFPAAADV